jgi:hypothetical protein
VELNSRPNAAIVTAVTHTAMTTRKPKSSASGQAERPATKAELQRIEERRHVEGVLRKGRRIKWPTKQILSKKSDRVKAAPTIPERKEPRPLTPAEKERLAERRHVENVMRNARRTRLQLRKKPRPAHSGAGGGSAAASEPSSVPGTSQRNTRVLIVAGALFACVLLGFSIFAVVQQGQLAARLSSLREDAALLRQKQQESIDKIGQAITQLEKVQTDLQTVAAGETQIASKVGALETARAAESAQWQERLTSLEKSTHDGLAEVSARLDNLSSAVEPKEEAPVQTASETAAP